MNPQTLRRWTTFFALGTVALMIALLISNRPLITGEAPRGGESLEFPSSPADAQAKIGSWDERRILPQARAHFRLDYPFIPFYVGLFVLVTICRRDRLPENVAPFWRKLASAAMIAAGVAGVLDLLEDLGMDRLLATFPHIDAGSAALVSGVFWAATLKFLLLFGCLATVAALDVRQVAAKVAAKQAAEAAANRATS